MHMMEEGWAHWGKGGLRGSEEGGSERWLRHSGTMRGTLPLEKMTIQRESDPLWQSLTSIFTFFFPFFFCSLKLWLFSRKPRQLTAEENMTGHTQKRLGDRGKGMHQSRESWLWLSQRIFLFFLLLVSSLSLLNVFILFSFFFFHCVRSPEVRSVNCSTLTERPEQLMVLYVTTNTPFIPSYIFYSFCGRGRAMAWKGKARYWSLCNFLNPLFTGILILGESKKKKKKGGAYYFCF